jgi:ribonuclease E
VPAEAVTAEAVTAEATAEEAAEAAPVRRTRRRAVKPSDAGGVETPAPLEPEAAAVAEGERPASEEAAAATDGQTPAGEEAVAVPRRKTRRGSRGGRGRRRKTEASVPLAGAGDGAPVDTPPHDAVARDAGEGDAPPAKPSRRRQARPVAIDGADQAGGSEADPAGDGHDPGIAPATSPSRRRRKATAAVEPAPDAEAGAAVAGAETLG